MTSARTTGARLVVVVVTERDALGEMGEAAAETGREPGIGTVTVTVIATTMTEVGGERGQVKEMAGIGAGRRAMGRGVIMSRRAAVGEQEIGTGNGREKETGIENAIGGTLLRGSGISIPRIEMVAVLRIMAHKEVPPTMSLLTESVELIILNTAGTKTETTREGIITTDAPDQEAEIEKDKIGTEMSHHAQAVPSDHIIQEEIAPRIEKSSAKKNRLPIA